MEEYKLSKTLYELDTALAPSPLMCR
uniref:Uncharacterized protein n=1 Tax=Anguilla anguilla TaxID=7936 RepID=A0A0E9QBH8_ANGAN